MPQRKGPEVVLDSPRPLVARAGQSLSFVPQTVWEVFGDVGHLMWAEH